MKNQSFFVRLQLFSFILLAIVLGMATYFLPQKNQQNFIRVLNNNFRTQYAVVSSFEQIRTSFYVYQRSLTRWLETGSPLWAQLVPQSQAVVEKRLDALELETQNEAATPILAAVAQLRGNFDNYFMQVSEHLVMESDQNLKVPLETRQFFVTGSADLLKTMSSLEQCFHDNIQASVGSVSKVFTQRMAQTHWALGGSAGLMLLWGVLILIQVIRQNKTLSKKFEANIIEPLVDLILPCHMQTYDWEQGAAAVFDAEEIKNEEEEENTEKTRLQGLEKTSSAEDEVLREVDEILAREIPKVDLTPRFPIPHPPSPTIVNMASPAANDYPDVVIALHQEDFQQQRRMAAPTDASQLYDQTSMPGVQVVSGGDEEVIMVDFDQERNDLGLKFKRRIQKG